MGIVIDTLMAVIVTYMDAKWLISTVIEWRGGCYGQIMPPISFSHSRPLGCLISLYEFDYTFEFRSL